MNILGCTLTALWLGLSLTAVALYGFGRNPTMFIIAGTRRRR